MMSLNRRVAFSVLAIAACGGTAVLDGGSSGSGGQGTTSGTTNVTTTNNVSVTTTTGPGGPCGQACTAIEGCLEISDCVSRCEQSPMECEAQQNEFLSCIAGQTTPGICEMPPPCVNALERYRNCRGYGALGGMCGADGLGNCDCQLFDEHGNNFTVQCNVAGGGSQCRCSMNGEPIGTCTSPNPMACDAVGDCCGTILHVPAPP